MFFKPAPHTSTHIQIPPSYPSNLNMVNVTYPSSPNSLPSYGLWFGVVQSCWGHHGGSDTKRASICMSKLTTHRPNEWAISNRFSPAALCCAVPCFVALGYWQSNNWMYSTRCFGMYSSLLKTCTIRTLPWQRQASTREVQAGEDLAICMWHSDASLACVQK